MIVLNQDAKTEKSLPNTPLPDSYPMDSKLEKERESQKAWDAQKESGNVQGDGYLAAGPSNLARNVSTMSEYRLTSPPPSYEPWAPEPSHQPFAFNRPVTSYNPPFPQPLPVISEPPHPQSQPRTLSQSASYSHLRPSPPGNYMADSSRPVSTFASSNTSLVPRSVDLFTTASAPPHSQLETGDPPIAPSIFNASSVTVNTLPPTPTPDSGPAASSSPQIAAPVFQPTSKKSFFTTSAANKKRNTKEARLFVLSQITLLLQNHTSPEYNLDVFTTILRGCADACSAHKLYLPGVLQEKSVEEHTPFYWAIAQRPSVNSPRMPELLQALLMFGFPLSEETRKDVGRACLLINDQSLFQALRVSKLFMGNAHQMHPVYKDRVTIENQSAVGGNGEFAVTLEIPYHRSRPLVHIEFIAQRRLWRLTIRRPPNKGWKISISLLEPSPPTYVDSRFIVQSILSQAPSQTTTSLPPPPPESPPVTPALAREMREPSTPPVSYPNDVAPTYESHTEFVRDAYSAYPPEKMQSAMQQSRNSSYEPDYGYQGALSFYPDIVRGGAGTNIAEKQRNESVSPTSSPSYSRQNSESLAADAMTISDSETVYERNAEDDEFSLAPYTIPPLPADFVIIREVRLKSTSMLTAGKKDIEVEIPLQHLTYNPTAPNTDPYADGEEKTLRARFEARLAKPESDCVIC